MLDDSQYPYCAGGGIVSSSTSGSCVVNHDGDDDTWKFFVDNASCKFTCIRSGCSQIGYEREVYLLSGCSFSLPDADCQLCATGTVNKAGDCWAENDGVNWQMSAEGTNCQFICLHR